LSGFDAGNADVTGGAGEVVAGGAALVAVGGDDREGVAAEVFVDAGEDGQQAGLDVLLGVGLSPGIIPIRSTGCSLLRAR
jgi:hypothetical protein